MWHHWVRRGLKVGLRLYVHAHVRCGARTRTLMMIIKEINMPDGRTRTKGTSNPPNRGSLHAVLRDAHAAPD